MNQQCCPDSMKEWGQGSRGGVKGLQVLRRLKPHVMGRVVDLEVVVREEFHGTFPDLEVQGVI